MFASPRSPLMMAMHIPDGFLSLSVALVFWALAMVIVSIATRRTQQDLADRQIPLMGVMAAFIFAAQMINFPVAGGTSGHLLGGALAAMVLGPWGGILVMTAVIAVQALLFQDGGLLAMGANIINMGVVPALIGYGLYRSVAAAPPKLRAVGIGAAAWLSVEAAALLASLQLWLSGTVALAVVLPAMLGVHALIGVGEALITVAALAAIARIRPDLSGVAVVRGRGGRAWVWGGMLMSLGVVLISPWASSHPDGLERVAADLGFLGNEQDTALRGLSGYTLPYLSNSGVATIGAGVIGILVVAAVVSTFVFVLRRRHRTA